MLYAVLGGLALGALGGYGIASAAVWLRDRELLSTDFDGWLSVPGGAHGLRADRTGGRNGSLAAFAAGVAFRRHEHTHEHNRRVHDGAEVVEKFGELAVILLIGSMLSWNGLAAPGLSGWLLVPVLLLVIRPAAVFLSLLGSKRALEGAGVRGVVRRTRDRLALLRCRRRRHGGACWGMRPSWSGPLSPAWWCPCSCTA